MSSLAWRELQAKVHKYEAQLVLMDEQLLADVDKAELRRFHDALAKIAELCRMDGPPEYYGLKHQALEVISSVMGSASVGRDPRLCRVETRACIKCKGHSDKCSDGRSSWDSPDAEWNRRSVAGTRASETKMAKEMEAGGK